MDAIETKAVLTSRVKLSGNNLWVAEKNFSLQTDGQLILVAVGKCALDAALTLEQILGERLGVALSVDVQEAPADLKTKIRYFTGDHPFPSERNVSATGEIKKILTNLTPADTVLVVVSGGGSTLLCQPANFTCLEEAEIIKALFTAGATIQDINLIRKHLSSARGGHLAALAYPAQVVGLIFSDVPGNDMSMVASGPTIYDESSVTDAVNLFEKFKLSTKVGLKTTDFIETPKDREKFSTTTNLMLVSNELALTAMADKAKELGFNPQVKTATLGGESAEVALDLLNDLHEVPAKSCLLYGGETIVTGGGAGSGGRAQEISLASLSGIKDDELILPFASDGRDNSEVAGAICDMISHSKSVSLNLPLSDFLARHDGLKFFEATGDTVVTGPTGANVSDLIISLKN